MEDALTGDVLAEVRAALNQALDREARLSTIIETLPEAIYSTSVEGTIQTWNPAAQRLFGYRHDEIEGLHVSILGPSGSGKRVRSILAALVAGGQVPEFEAIHVTSSGAQITTRDAVAPIRDVAGNVVAVVWSSRDISELKWLEKLVWEEKERTEAAFDLVADAVLMTDVEGRVVYLNSAAHRLTGWSIAEAHGRPIDEIAPLEHEESREKVASPAHTALQTDQVIQPGFHNMVIHREGTAFPVEDSAAPIRARDGSVAGAVLVLRPVGRKFAGRQQPGYLAQEDPATGQID